MKKLVFVFLLLVLPLVHAELGIEAVSKSPESINPGESITLDIKVVNDGDTKVEDIRVGLDLTNLPFAPVESSEKIINEIKKDRDSRVVFELDSLPEIKPGIYKIPLNLNYNGIKSTAFTSVIVNSNPALEIGIEESTLVTLMQKGRVVIRLVNTGDSELKFLSVEVPRSINYEILSQNSFYVGNIDSDDFETVELEMILKNNANIIPVKVNYKDVFNKDFKMAYNLEIKTYTEKEALELGLIEQTNVFLLLGIGLVIVIFFLYKLYRKRKI